MKKVVMIDSDGMYVKDVILKDDEEIPANCIAEKVPAGFYHPKWDGQNWIEGLTHEQIETLKAEAAHQKPTLEERVQALELLELERLFGGS